MTQAIPTDDPAAEPAGLRRFSDSDGLGEIIEYRADGHELVSEIAERVIFHSDHSDDGVVSIHREPGGRFVVAVGFRADMGGFRGFDDGHSDHVCHSEKEVRNKLREISTE